MTVYALNIQKAIVDALEAAGIAEGRVFDRVPAGVLLPYVSIGPADEIEADADCIEAVEVAQQIDVWSDQPGYPESKRIAAEIRSALHRRPLLVDGVSIEFEVRTIRYLRDRDGLLSHAVIDLRALVERE